MYVVGLLLSSICSSLNQFLSNRTIDFREFHGELLELLSATGEVGQTWKEAKKYKHEVSAGLS